MGVRGARKWALAGAVVLGLLVVVIVALGEGGATTPDPDHAAQLAPREDSLVGEGSEGGGEEGAVSASAVDVETRAYPRTYVSDRVALRGSRAFERLPASASADSFHSKQAFRAARAAAPRRWQTLGPLTPNVAPGASQFIDPETGMAAPTMASGRVTAMAIDPYCGERGHGCRVWVAAAGGGIWRTDHALAGHVHWAAPTQKLPTNSFGSLYVDPNDHSGDTIYAGSGEPNGSSDSEAALGLFRSRDGGRHWHLVKGSTSVAIDRSIGTIAVKRGHPNVIYIGTDVARHGSSGVGAGEALTPPNAPALGLYKSTDGGRHFRIFSDLQRQTPASPKSPASGRDLFQGGVNRVELDPSKPRRVYAAVFGYGLWRSVNGGKTWRQVFHTVDQTDFSNPDDPGDIYGDRTEFDLVSVRGHTRIYLVDSSSSISEVWRAGHADTRNARLLVGDGDNAGWAKLSSSQNGTNGFLARDLCVGQCFYDNFIASPPGRPGEVWIGGSMRYGELAAYGGVLRSNGRSVIRSTNAGAPPAKVTWQDMTQDARPSGETQGMHPDQHAIAFPRKRAGIALVGSDGGVVRAHLGNPADRSADCAERDLGRDDLIDCRRLLSAIPRRIDPLNDGLNDLQFGSLSVNPDSARRELLAGAQDNGTWHGWLERTSRHAWSQVSTGDGGPSAFDAGNPRIGYLTYQNGIPAVNFHSGNPARWIDITYPLESSGEEKAFYTPLIADPIVAGRAFIGFEHVWRTDDHGGNEAALEATCAARGDARVRRLEAARAEPDLGRFRQRPSRW